MKYVVVCYSIHNKEIENYEVFNSEGEAFDYLGKEVEEYYHEEIPSGFAKMNINDYGEGYVESSNGKYQWTWEVIRVRTDDDKTYKTRTRKQQKEK